MPRQNATGPDRPSVVPPDTSTVVYVAGDSALDRALEFLRSKPSSSDIDDLQTGLEMAGQLLPTSPQQASPMQQWIEEQAVLKHQDPALCALPEDASLRAGVQAGVIFMVGHAASLRMEHFPMAREGPDIFIAFDSEHRALEFEAAAKRQRMADTAVLPPDAARYPLQDLTWSSAWSPPTPHMHGLSGSPGAAADGGGGGGGGGGRVDPAAADAMPPAPLRRMGSFDALDSAVSDEHGVSGAPGAAADGGAGGAGGGGGRMDPAAPGETPPGTLRRVGSFEALDRAVSNEHGVSGSPGADGGAGGGGGRAGSAATGMPPPEQPAPGAFEVPTRAPEGRHDAAAMSPSQDQLHGRLRALLHSKNPEQRDEVIVQWNMEELLASKVPELQGLGRHMQNQGFDFVMADSASTTPVLFRFRFDKAMSGPSSDRLLSNHMPALEQAVNEARLAAGGAGAPREHASEAIPAARDGARGAGSFSLLHFKDVLARQPAAGAQQTPASPTAGAAAAAAPPPPTPGRQHGL
ncbi:hypothetical protein [Hydrogenophaga sp.]|uniref:hypothetical protein n=1 Tax=Hydrogenophaga sp. TaxID=1904254 RepID=UPI00262D033C|nr:hypothetical protein [Hydrogenophaga sp.]MCW5653190.1 hypothetical protein [Hydrogenophaga sp.]